MNRNLRYLFGGAVAFHLSSKPVLGHEQEHASGPSWLLWGKLTLFALGAVCIAAGVYIDQNREQRVKYADYLIIAGFLLALTAGISLFR